MKIILIFNLLLIPELSYYGAAIATIIAEISVFLSLLFFAKKLIKVDFKHVYFRSLISFCIPAPLLFLNISILIRFTLFVMCFLWLNLALRLKVKDPVISKLKQKLWMKGI